MNELQIIITLSGEKISMSYTTEERRGITLPLPDMAQQQPLTKFLRTEEPRFDGLFCMEVIKRIERFLDTNEDREERQHLDRTEIVFIIGNDLPDELLVSIEKDFRIRGVKARMIRPDLLIAEYYRRNYDFHGIVIADSDGKNLFLSCALKDRPGEVARLELKGSGADPRLDGLAKEIWGVISYHAVDLTLEDEMERLTECAARFIETGKAELDCEVTLSDGNSYALTIYKSMIPDSDSRMLEADFSGFLGEKGNLSDHSKSVLVLRGEATGSRYLRDLLSPGFKEVAEVKGALYEALIRLALSEDAPSFQAKELTVTCESPTRRVTRENDDEQPATIGKTSEPDLLPIKIEATVEKIKSGLFKKKSVLKIKISSPKGDRIKWHSVLCVQEKPLSSIMDENIVREYDRGDSLPFSLDLELPLRQCPQAKRLRIYFKPHPDEPVGINNAYQSEGCTVNI